MLQTIIFILSEYYFTFVKSHKETLEQKVLTHGTNIELISAAHHVKFTAKNSAELSSHRETLFITDDPVVLEKLLRAGLYTIALYHENNKASSFPGALYAVEDIFRLEYRSYEEAYRRLAGLPWDILETDRLFVRESTLDDIPDFYRLYENPAITDYMEPLFEDPAEERAYLQDYIKQVYGFYGFGIWTVILKKTGQIIGRAGLNIREGYELPELGFVIDTALQNQGLAYEVCSAILDYAKEELAFRRIQAFVKEENYASRKLLEKLGFVYHREAWENNRKYLLYITVPD